MRAHNADSVLITDEQIRQDEWVQRAENAIVQWCEEHDGPWFEALFSTEGRELSARLGAARVHAAARLRSAQQ